MKKITVSLFLLLGLFSCTKGFIENEALERFKENIEEIESINDSKSLGLIENTATGIFWKKTKEVALPRYATQDLVLHIAYTLKTVDGQILFQKQVADSTFFDSNAAANSFTGLLFAVANLGETEKGVFYLPAAAAFGDSPPAGVALQPYQVTVLEVEMVRHYGELDLIDLYIKRNGFSLPEFLDNGVRMVRLNERTETEDLMIGDKVLVKYKGYFLDNRTFDEGEISVTLGSSNVIAGFEEGVANLRVGEKATVIIPWEQAYGASGNNSIPPFTTLAFDLEILSKES